MSSPKTIKDFGNGWVVKKWEYDEAPLELRGPCKTEIYIDKEDIEIIFEADYDGLMTRYIPLEVFKEWLKMTGKFE